MIKKNDTYLVNGKKINWSIFHLLCSEISTKEIELINVNIEWKTLKYI